MTRSTMVHDANDTQTPAGAARERGAAIIIALMVALVLAFLGLGLLLQTSLGLQAAGTDRWVVRALYAADAGAQMEIVTLLSGSVAQGTFVLADDPNLPGFLRGQFNVNVTDICEIQPPSEAVDPASGTTWDTTFRARHFFFRSAAARNAGGMVGLSRAEITQDVTVMPIPIDQIFPATTCY